MPFAPPLDVLLEGLAPPRDGDLWVLSLLPAFHAPLRLSLTSTTRTLRIDATLPPAGLPRPRAGAPPLHVARVPRAVRAAGDLPRRGRRMTIDAFRTRARCA